MLQRFKQYVNPTERPGQHNIKIIYYHVFNDVASSENNLIDYIRGMMHEYKDASGEVFNTHSFMKNQGSREWFSIHEYEEFGGFDNAYSIIEDWISQHKSNNFMVKQLNSHTKLCLEKEKRIFISKHPE